MHNSPNGTSESSQPDLPDAPRPSADSGIQTTIQHPSDDHGAIPHHDQHIDIFKLTPLAALKLLCASIESLTRAQPDDRPPTPPSSLPNTPIFPSSGQFDSSSANTNPKSPEHDSPTSHHHKDIPDPHKTPIGSPESHPTELVHGPNPAPHFSIDDVASPLYQRTVLARKFYSKSAPPIPLQQYLHRLHTYCPMSTAVYLAAGLYIRRLSHAFSSTDFSISSHSLHSTIDDDEEDFAVPVTERTKHRLLLAALRVATKALEDQSYPHARFAKVGGVREKELARLEVSFCFLSGFRLRVPEGALVETAEWMRGFVGEGFEWGVE